MFIKKSKEKINLKNLYFYVYPILDIYKKPL